MKDEQSQNSTTETAGQVEPVVICYRCGWCGAPTTEYGEPITCVDASKMNVDWDQAISVNGIGCCQGAYEHQKETERQITEDMMRDAGYN